MEKLIQYIKAGLLRLQAISWKELAKQKTKDPIFWVRFSAYAIPLAFLLYVLYINLLPFGYRNTFVVDVGGPNDTKVSEFYLEPSPNLSERKTTEDGTTYRELNGSAFAVFKPNAILKDAKVTVSVEGEGVFLIPPILNFDPSSIDWDYSWDFIKEIPKDLKGNAFVFDGATYFNGRDTRLELPDSADMFEDGPFSVYTEWEPKDSENNAQQIVGHYNWEIFQNKDSVSFQVGRMNNTTGTIFTVKYPITLDFFNKKHSVLAIYSPQEVSILNPISNGYIDLYIDEKLAGRTYFNSDIIWKNYGNKNVSFGKSNHGSAQYLKGSLYKVKYISQNILKPQSKINFNLTKNDLLNISIISTNVSSFNKIKLNVVQ